jgi:hypothetical protein
LDCARGRKAHRWRLSLQEIGFAFRQKNSGRSGCATMFLAERLERDVENQGNRLIAWTGALLNLVTRYVPDYPPPIPLLERQRKLE